MTGAADGGPAPIRTGAGVGPLVSVLLATLLALGVGAGCATAPASGHDSEGEPAGSAEPEPAAAGAAADAAPPVSDSASAQAGDQPIPPDYVPPPGQCRIWVPGEPPEQQARDHPVGRCSELRLTVPEHAWLIYRPMDGGTRLRVWQYGSERQVLFQRYYDLTTGELLRHVAPASGD